MVRPLSRRLEPPAPLHVGKANCGKPPVTTCYHSSALPASNRDTLTLIHSTGEVLSLARRRESTNRNIRPPLARRAPSRPSQFPLRVSRSRFNSPRLEAPRSLRPRPRLSFSVTSSFTPSLSLSLSILHFAHLHLSFSAIRLFYSFFFFDAASRSNYLRVLSDMFGGKIRQHCFCYYEIPHGKK